MNADFFLKGLIIGFLIAAPLGPIGVLCVHRTLTKGKIHGLISGLGAATADAVYAYVAALGLTIISSFLIEQQLWFRIIGIIFLCGLGLRTIFSKPVKSGAAVNGRGLAANYGSTFFLTLTNPMTILSFAAVFAGANAARSHFAALLIAGVFTGSCVWWIFLSSAADLFRQKINDDNLIWLNRISGIIIILFGLLLLFDLKK